MVTTGLMRQELLQGFSGPKASAQRVERFAAPPLLHPDCEDHIAAAARRNTCGRAGVQVVAVAALLAQLCIRHDPVLLNTDKDFTMSAKHWPLRVWSPGAKASVEPRKGSARR